MNTSRIVGIARIAALSALICWIAKAVAIGLAGGLDLSPAETPLFAAGLVCYLVAAALVGAALPRTSRPLVRVVGGVLGVVGGFLLVVSLVTLIDAARVPTPDRPWVWSEVPLWIAALLVLGATHMLARRVDARPLAASPA